MFLLEIILNALYVLGIFAVIIGFIMYKYKDVMDERGIK